MEIIQWRKVAKGAVLLYDSRNEELDVAASAGAVGVSKGEKMPFSHDLVEEVVLKKMKYPTATLNVPSLASLGENFLSTELHPLGNSEAGEEFLGILLLHREFPFTKNERKDLKSIITIAYHALQRAILLVNREIPLESGQTNKQRMKR